MQWNKLQYPPQQTFSDKTLMIILYLTAGFPRENPQHKPQEQAMTISTACPGTILIPCDASYFRPILSQVGSSSTLILCAILH